MTQEQAKIASQILLKQKDLRYFYQGLSTLKTSIHDNSGCFQIGHATTRVTIPNTFSKKAILKFLSDTANDIEKSLNSELEQL